MYDDMPTEEQIRELQKKGHTFHCAMRILTGDGECECNMTDNIPSGISKAMYKNVCPVCLELKGSPHKKWCRNKTQGR